MNNKSSARIETVLIVAVCIVCFLLICPIVAHAEETSTDTTEESTSDDERINNLEKRLEELGYQISETKDSIVAIEDRLDPLEADHLSLQQELELLLIGLNDQLELLNTISADLTASSALLSDHLPTVVMQGETLQEDTKSLYQETVSGNTLVSDLGDSLKVDMENISQKSLEEFNKTLLSTNKLLSYLFVLLLVLLVLFIVGGLGKIIKDTLLKYVE